MQFLFQSAPTTKTAWDVSFLEATPLPWPCIGDRVLLRGGKAHKNSRLARLYDQTWATVVAVTTKHYLIVEPDIKPGEMTVGLYDISRYEKRSHCTATVRSIFTLEEWHTNVGEQKFWEKQRKYKTHLRKLQKALAQKIKIQLP
jgi:hypothetical protein